MKVEIKDRGPWQKVLAIEVPPEEMDRTFEAVVEEYRNRAALPGFRKGKVPRNVLELQFGHSMEHEVLERAVKRSYERAIREQNLDPVSYPTIDKIDFQRGRALSYEAQVEIRPELTPRDYFGLELSDAEAPLSDADVEQALEDLRQRTVEWAPVDREAGPGDAVSVDYVRLNAKGRPVHRSEQKDAIVELGAKGLLPEFQSNLAGTKAGDHRTFEVRYPEDFGNEELRGKAATFSVQVQGVRERRLRPLDDEFAQVVAGMRDLGELRSRLRLNLEGERRLRVRRTQEDQLIGQLIARNPFELPEGMVREYLDELIRRLKAEGQEWTPEEADRLRNEYRPVAERRIKRDLLLDAIARTENVAVSEGEVDEMLRGAAEGEVPPPETERLLRSPEQRERARSHLVERKVFGLLREKARLKMAAQTPDA